MLKHYPVLKNELIDGFMWQGGALLDCTLGFGGHTLAFLQANKDTKIYAFDRDASAINMAKERLKEYKNIDFYHNTFANALDSLGDENIKHLRGIIADIGVSSMQLDDAKRGFGFESMALDMRMDIDSQLDAQKVLNTYSQMQLEEIFRIYGEIRQSKKLAQLIVEERKKKPFSSCYEFSSLLKRYMPNIGGLHPATLAFQAVRIEVNDELAQLRSLLQNIEKYFSKGMLKHCKIGIISFHSLEDRIIKQYFKKWSKSCVCTQESYKCECGNNNAMGKILTKKPIKPTLEEIAKNKRSRSAKLRIFELEMLEAK